MGWDDMGRDGLGLMNTLGYRYAEVIENSVLE